MFESNSDSEETRFNLDWLTGIVSIVSEQTNKDSDYIMFNMSLTECMYYVIQYARKNSDKPEMSPYIIDCNQFIRIRSPLSAYFYYNTTSFI